MKKQKSKFDVLRNLSTEDSFTTIYKNRIWTSRETASGTGSELVNTVNIRKELPLIFDKHGIDSILDLGCGDVNWISTIFGSIRSYRGVDVVEEMINHNKDVYSYTDHVEFKQANLVENICADDRPFDCCILKDVLVHLTNKDAKKVIDNIRKAEIKWLLATNFDIEKNKNLKFNGNWRSVNLKIKPYNLGESVEDINDYGPNDRIQNKTLSLWKL